VSSVVDPHGLDVAPRHDWAASGASDRHRARLQSFTPTEYPFTRPVFYHVGVADALMTFLPSEACQLIRWSFDLPLCTSGRCLPPKGRPLLAVL
jgi:hypothetical protein